jgi:hypothetical protein
MQVKVTPLNPNAVTGEFEASSNVSYPQLAEGKLRVRVAFLPTNEQQHDLVAKMLSVSEAKIVQVSADPLLKIEREVHPSLPPKVHMMGSPLWMDIEIGPRALALDASSGVEALSAAPGAPAALPPATPSGGTPPPPAKTKSSRSRKKAAAPAPADHSANQAASDTADDTAEDGTADEASDSPDPETVN